ncbi:MAG: molybdate ABC transporter substrate-binding protein [Steroidobacteraceae bacterium]
MRSSRRSTLLAAASALLLGLVLISRGESAEVQVAVASNFAAPAKSLARAFHRTTGHRAVISLGATGKLYAQIRQGAPYEVLLAADAATPAKLIDEGLALADTRMTYAIGRLVLWSRDTDRMDSNGKILSQGQFRRLAIANPKLAPYGAAAVQTLQALGALERLRSRLVEAANINQTFQFVASGNAEVGFVALSQVTRHDRLQKGSAWIVPANLHDPIIQEAVVLKRAGRNPAAQAWIRYLASNSAHEIIRSYGYELPR